MQVGFYGKLPSHGDFVRRRVSDAFVDAWDAWLQQCIRASKDALGPRWLDLYLTSPAWRFVCAAGVCGPAPLIGLLAPSVDQSGRYFPLTLVSELPDDLSLVAAATASAAFFEAAERLVIETLAAERVDFERFDDGVLSLDEELDAVQVPPEVVLDPAAVALLTDVPRAWQLPIGASSLLPAALAQLLSLQLEAKYKPLVLWWTDGSMAVDPSCLIVKGLPEPAMYSALLEGSWTAHRWQPVAVHSATESTLASTVADGLQPLSFRSAATTDVGRARGNNEDGFLERPEVGLWAVADGMGGHSHGEVASRMVCDALIDFQPDGTFEEAVVSASARVQQVNDHLVKATAGAIPSDRSGSTVAVLLLRGLRSAVLWAGDSRVYRWRAGQLEQLSRDHSLAELIGAVGESSVITRAVGIQAPLTLDIRRDGVLPNDRFLLCSDGLTRVIPDAAIGAWMASPNIRDAVDGLIKATLDAGAPDNVTVVIAEAYR